MNYYERIQQSIEEIESQLETPIEIENLARTAYMSISSFYRMFFSLTGFTVKEYIRLRRLSEAARDLKQSEMHIIDIAVKYVFDSADSFSRAFKKTVGILPSQYRKLESPYYFERMNLMDRYFDVQDEALLERYPDIKVLKELQPMRVAYSHYYGEDPETHAFDLMTKWLSKIGLDINQNNLRIFGYNNPSPTSPDQKAYGYEVCVTIGDEIVVEDECIKEKTLSGGLYAVTGVKRNADEDMGEEIVKSWQRLSKWLKDSKYTYGGHQWLEEHLGFDEASQHVGGIDIYLPIELKNSNDSESVSIEVVSPQRIACCMGHGEHAIDEARQCLLSWAADEGIFENEIKPMVFAYYNHDRMGKEDFFYKMMITIPEQLEVSSERILVEEFPGGKYLMMKTKQKRAGYSWGNFLKWMSEQNEYVFGQHWFFETYEIEKPSIEMETEMKLYLPIK